MSDSDGQPPVTRYGRRSARRSLFQTAAFRTLSQLATFASYVVLVRAMTEHDFGILNLLYAVIPVIATLASFGIEQTLRRYQPEYLRAEKVHAAAWLVSVAARSRIAVNIVVLGLILLLWDQIAPIFQLGPYRLEFAGFCLLIMLYFQATILQLALSSHMLQGYAVGMTAAWSLIKLIGYTALSWMGHLTLDGAILTDTIAYAFMYAGLRFGYAHRCRLEPPAEPFRMPSDERKRLIRYGLYNNFNDAGTLLLTSKTDNFFIAALMSPVATGTYAFFVRLNEMCSHVLPTRQFSNVIQPLFFAVPRDQAAQRVPRYFTFLLNLTLVVQLPITAYFTVYHREIVQTLFAGKFIEYSWLLPFVAWWAALGRIADPVTLVAQYQEKAGVILASKVFGIYNAVALVLLVPVLGVYGAAIATGSAQAMKSAFIWWRVRDLARWSNWRGVAAMTILVWGGMVGLCYAVKYAGDLHPVVDMGFGIVIAAAAVLLYLRSPAICASDREILATVFHGRERRILQMMGLASVAERGRS